MGLLYSAQGQLQKALDSFKKANQMNSEHFRVYLETAKTLRDLKMDQPAKEAFLKAQKHLSNVRQLMALTQEQNRNT
jgi:tetratricopeptide (TPR) repeat protein